MNTFSSWTMALSRTPRGTSSTLTTSLTNPYEDLSNYSDIHEYLATTNRLPPKHALQAEEEGYETASEEMLEYDPPEADPTAVRRAFTDKLIKTMDMSFNQFSKNRRHTMESALLAHQQGRRIFWEVFSGSANLSRQMSSEDWLVECFVLNTGWNSELSQHWREFLHLLDVTCPDFVWFASLYGMVPSPAVECGHDRKTRSPTS